jgi:hypothetical protein
VKRFDPVTREAQGIQRGAIAGPFGFRDLARVDPQSRLAKVDAVEFQREFDQCRVATGDDIGDNGANRLFDIGRDLAFGGQELLEAGGKIGVAAV